MTKFVLRKDQMEAFSVYMVRNFEKKMLHHLRETFKEQTAARDDASLLGAVQAGIKKSLKYGIEMEDDIRRYLEHMVIYGDEFDTDPKTSWAREILTLQNIDGTAKMNMIDDTSVFVQ